MSWMFNNLYISKLFLYIIAMKELSVTEAREQFPALLNQAAKKPVWITRHGVDVAVVISPELFEELVSAQEELEDMAKVDEAREGPMIQVVDVASPPERKTKPAKAGFLA